MLTVLLLCCVAHSAEHSKSAPTGDEAAQPMATDAVVGRANAATPDVGTSVAAPEPWMNHVSNFLLDPFSCRSVRVLNIC